MPSLPQGQPHTDNGSGLYGLQLKNGVLRDHHQQHDPSVSSTYTANLTESNRLQVTNTNDTNNQQQQQPSNKPAGMYSQFGFHQDVSVAGGDQAPTTRGVGGGRRKKRPKLYRAFNLHEESARAESDWQSLTAGRRRSKTGGGGGGGGARVIGGRQTAPKSRIEGAELAGWQGNRNKVGDIIIIRACFLTIV